MNYNKYNEQRYNQRKQWYRVRLGVQQMVNRPVINLIWLLFGGGVVWWIKGMTKFILMAKVHPLLEGIFENCISFITIVFPIICLVAMLQFIGCLTARKDESVRNMLLALNEGFTCTTSYSSRNHSYDRKYLIQAGKLIIQETGKTSWADSRYDETWIAGKDELLRFLRDNLHRLKKE